jgi:hypothetical protein
MKFGRSFGRSSGLSLLPDSVQLISMVGKDDDDQHVVASRGPKPDVMIVMNAGN